MTSDSSLPLITTLRELQRTGMSLRTLSREAGIDPSLLTRIARGERTATPAVAERLAAGLERWASRCVKAAEVIRNHPRRAL
jgi:transcriptional regulator with XRE-family HTH domain